MKPSNDTASGFQFEVVWDGAMGTFKEVSGLDAEVQVIEYRDSSSAVFSTVKMPGIAKYGNVILKKGVFSAVKQVVDLRSQVAMNTVQRRTVTIRLLDGDGQTTMTWTLNNAWPTKLKNMVVSPDGRVVTIESIEIAHEGLTITHG